MQQKVGRDDGEGRQRLPVHLLAHDDLRILYDFTFYVSHSTSDDVSSLFVMFFARTIWYF